MAPTAARWNSFFRTARTCSPTRPAEEDDLIPPPTFHADSRGNASSPRIAGLRLIPDVKIPPSRARSFPRQRGGRGIFRLTSLTGGRQTLLHYPAPLSVQQPRIKAALQQKVLLGTPGFKIGSGERARGDAEGPTWRTLKRANNRCGITAVD